MIDRSQHMWAANTIRVLSYPKSREMLWVLVCPVDLVTKMNSLQVKLPW